MSPNDYARRIIADHSSTVGATRAAVERAERDVEHARAALAEANVAHERAMADSSRAAVAEWLLAEPGRADELVNVYRLRSALRVASDVVRVDLRFASSEAFAAYHEIIVPAMAERGGDE